MTQLLQLKKKYDYTKIIVKKHARLCTWRSVQKNLRCLINSRKKKFVCTSLHKPEWHSNLTKVYHEHKTARVSFTLDKPGLVFTSNVGTVLSFTGSCKNCLDSYYLPTGKMACYNEKYTECTRFDYNGMWKSHTWRKKFSKLQTDLKRDLE